MNLHDYWMKAINDLILSTQYFYYVPARSQVTRIDISEAGIGPDNIKEDMDSWELVYDDKDKVPRLNIFKSGKFRAALKLTRDGDWKGREFGSKGTIIFRPPEESRSEWVKIANPLEYAKTIQSDSLEEEFRYRDHLPPQIHKSEDIWDIREHINSEKVIDSQTAIAIVGCDRQSYFQQSVQSIALNPETQKLPVFIFLDAPEEKNNRYKTKEQVAVAKKEIPHCIIIKRSRNLGCGRQLIDVRRQLFDFMQFRKVFIFEDDMIVPSNYIRYVSQMFSWATDKYSNIGAVQGWSYCDLKPNTKKSQLDLVQATYTNWWGYCMSIDAWKAIRDLMYTYEELFLGGAYSRRPHRSIKHWFDLKMKRPKAIVGTRQFKEHPGLDAQRKNYFSDPPSGQDAATMHLFEALGWTRLAPIVNRGKYIGKQGIHMNPSLFSSHGLDKISFEEYPDDVKRRSFLPCQEASISEISEDVQEKKELRGIEISTA